MEYTDIRFADIQLLRYRVDGFEELSLKQKCYVYYLSQAAIAGRDILWDQNYRLNLAIRQMLEAVYQYVTLHPSPFILHPSPFLTYLRQIWFANGIHHHYSMDKFHPEFSEEELRGILREMDFPCNVTDCLGNTWSVDTLIEAIFNPDIAPKRVNQAQGDDLLLTSAMNYYGPDVTQKEAEAYYNNIKKNDPQASSQPPMYGLNSRLEHDSKGQLNERTWRSGGMYGPIIDRIIQWLQLAHEVAENEQQQRVIEMLIDFYHTGDLRTFDLYTILWVQQNEGLIDFTNGFTEVYGDPLGLKASWEGYVNLKDMKATERTRRLSENAQWFEDHSPVDPAFKKRECRGISAKVVIAAILGGDLYPASAIGINLPNSNWVRQQYGSKSVTIGNLTYAYAQAARSNGFREEFYHPDALSAFDFQLSHKLDDLHTDLHECLGHGSGQLLPGVDPDTLGPYGSTIEEARADLFALYYIADPKMVELGLVPDGEAYHEQFYSYMLNGLMTQLVRIEPGKQIEEAHMRNRALIAHWVMEHSHGAMKVIRVHEGQNPHGFKSHLTITDYPAVRKAVSELLAEVQRIKSTGDLDAARNLVETYGVQVDPDLHNEMLQRYRALDIAPYKGFINPVYTPVCNSTGEITDIAIRYDETYDQQMLRYGRTN